jgi:hypothetical protein
MGDVLQRNVKRDQNLEFLNHFIELYEAILDHHGYGDIEVSVRNSSVSEKEVILRFGKEFRFRVQADNTKKISNRSSVRSYRAVTSGHLQKDYCGVERRSEVRRTNGRRAAITPRNFRLERRQNLDRRRIIDRRKK